jgi:hypothetical protein
MAARDRCGWEGAHHAETGQIALPAQLGQLSRLVNSTSQSTQNNASASLIGPSNTVASDSIGCCMAHPPGVISGEAGGAVRLRADPTSDLHGTVPLSRGKTDATGSSRAESPVYRAEGTGGRIVRGDWFFAYLRGCGWTESDRIGMPSNGSAPARHATTILGVCGGSCHKVVDVRW